jgi:hypothetical protein
LLLGLGPGQFGLRLHHGLLRGLGGAELPTGLQALRQGGAHACSL